MSEPIQDPGLSLQVWGLFFAVLTSVITGVIAIYQNLDGKIRSLQKEITNNKRDIDKNFNEIRVQKHHSGNQNNTIIAKIEDLRDKAEQNDNNIYQYAKRKMNIIVKYGNRDRILIRKLYRKVFNQDLDEIVTDERLTQTGESDNEASEFFRS